MTVIVSSLRILSPWLMPSTGVRINGSSKIPVPATSGFTVVFSGIASSFNRNKNGRMTINTRKISEHSHHGNPPFSSSSWISLSRLSQIPFSFSSIGTLALSRGSVPQAVSLTSNHPSLSSSGSSESHHLSSSWSEGTLVLSNISVPQKSS